MIGRLLNAIHGGTVEAASRLRQVPALVGLMRDPERARSFHPEAEHKSAARIWAEQVWWLLGRGEVNAHYWFYGLDRRDAPAPRTHLTRRVFIAMRDAANSTGRLNGRYLNYRCLLRDKLLFDAWCRQCGMPCPPLLASGEGERVRWFGTQADEPLETITQHEGVDVFCKDRMGECGMAVFPLSVSGGRLWLDGKATTADALAARVGARRYVLQQTIRQRDDLARLHAASVNTMRLITVQDGDSLLPFGSFLRIGTGGCSRDNAAQGGVFVALDWQREKLGRDGYFRLGYGTRIDRHPDSGICFDDYPIPGARAVMDQVRAWHRQHFPGLFSIGWDIAMTDTGPMVLEANDGWELRVSAAALGIERVRFEALCKAWIARHGWKPEDQRGMTTLRKGDGHG